MDDVPLAGQGAQLLAERGDRVGSGGGLFDELDVVTVVLGVGGLVSGFRGLGLVRVLDVQRRLLEAGSCGLGVSGFGLVWLDSVRRLDDVGLVLAGRGRLVGVVQVRVRHVGCFFLASRWVEHAERDACGRPPPPRL